MKKRGKRGQILGLPFGVIFSIILIIAFIVVAFFVIKHFLCLGDQTKSGMFFEDFEKDVNEAFRSVDIESNFSYAIPGRVDYVCFVDFSRQGSGKNKEIYNKLKLYELRGNLFLYPISQECLIWNKNIEHIDLGEMTKEDNPYCKEVKNSKIEFYFTKGAFEDLVKIK